MKLSHSRWKMNLGDPSLKMLDPQSEKDLNYRLEKKLLKNQIYNSHILLLIIGLSILIVKFFDIEYGDL